MDNKKKICFIINPNGYGHIQRNLQLIKKLNKIYDLTLISDKKKILKFKRPSNMKVLDFQNNLDIQKITYDRNWIKKYNFEKYDLIISDNFPEVGILKNNVIIFANFFFHNLKFQKNKIDHILKKKKLRYMVII